MRAWTMFKVCVSVLFVLYFKSFYVNGISTCLSCKDVIQPRDCTTIERCGPASRCYTEAYITSLGYPRFNLGCRDIMQCQNVITTAKKRDGTLFFCEECCVGNLCNQDGCNQTGYTAPNKRGPICYDCLTQRSTNDCQNIKTCRQGEVCKLKRILYGANDEIRYETKCEYNDTCTDEVGFYQPVPAVGKRSVQEFSLGNTCMIQCCDTDLCNTGCTKYPTTTTITTTTLPAPVKKPSIDTFIPNATAKFFKLGSRINLACDSMSLPEPNITWTGSFSSTYSFSINSKNLTLASLQPSQVGKYTCTVTNIYGSTSRTIIITSNVTGALDCDFETAESCLWTNNQLDSGDWLNSRNNSALASSIVDPSDVRATGTFLFTHEDSLMYDTVVDLVSPQLGSEGPVCMSFLYRIHPYEQTDLQVQIEADCEFNMPCTGAVPLTVVLHGKPGNKGWQLALIPIPAVTSRHRIVIKSLRHHDTADRAYSAIDEIRYYSGTCKQTLRLEGPRSINITVDQGFPLWLNCSIHGYPRPVYLWSKLEGCGAFNNVTGSTVVVAKHASSGDSGTYICSAENSGPYTNIVKQTFLVKVNSTYDQCTFEHGLCGWNQLIGDDFDWTSNSGPTLSQFTGPNTDHTLGNGTYLYVEASSPRLLGDTAILRSPRQAGNTSICFSFYYHMFGNDTGQLNVSLKDTCSGKQTTLLNKVGSQPAKWLYYSIDITAKMVPHDYYIQIKAVIGKSYHGDIAIDDLLIHHGQCRIKRLI